MKTSVVDAEATLWGGRMPPYQQLHVASVAKPKRDSPSRPTPLERSKAPTSIAPGLALHVVPTWDLLSALTTAPTAPLLARARESYTRDGHKPGQGTANKTPDKPVQGQGQGSRLDTRGSRHLPSEPSQPPAHPPLGQGCPPRKQQHPGSGSPPPRRCRAQAGLAKLSRVSHAVR